eukprot:497467-Pelagomonas_calceolata.AAC.1
MRPEHAGVLKASHECVLHHPVAGRGALPSQAKMTSIVPDILNRVRKRATPARAHTHTHTP